MDDTQRENLAWTFSKEIADYSDDAENTKAEKTECDKIELKCCKTAMYGAKNMSITYIGQIL